MHDEAVTEQRTSPVAIDARRDEIYFQLFGGDHHLPLTEPLLVSAGHAASLLRDRETFVAGSGAARVCEAARARARELSPRLTDLEPNARYLTGLDAAVCDGPVRPLYLRAPDAKPSDAHIPREARMKADGALDPKYVSLLWAGPERVSEVATLHGELFDPPWNEAAIRPLLDHPAATCLVAVVGNPKTPVGFVIGQLAADEAEIISIGVAKSWQRSGLGRRLIEGLARAAARAEAKTLCLEVAADNIPALVLYHHLGLQGGRAAQGLLRARRRRSGRRLAPCARPLISP